MSRFWMVVSVVLLLASLAAVGWHFSRQSNAPAFVINDEEVESITAEVFSMEPTPYVIQGVPPTEIPAEYIPTILDALRPITILRYTKLFDDLPQLGKLTINKRDNTVVEIVFPMWGQNPLAYKFNGVHCIRGGSYRPMYDMVDDGKTYGYGDESWALATAIQEIHREQTSGLNSERLIEALELLECSAGKRPPKK